MIRIGTAGWSIAKQDAAAFPDEGSHLERYARVLNAVEINSSFYRPHARKTYERWGASVPDAFRFSVKLPKAISHVARLTDYADTLTRFADEVAGLGPKLGAVLIQLPPSLAFDPAIAARFFDDARTMLAVPLVCEPRHASWFTDDANALLADHRIARVAADPPVHPGADDPGGWTGLAYLRLHGSPVIYRSPYGPERLPAIADALRLIAESGDAWCIFDNTASMAALGDALDLKARLAL